MVNEDDGLTKFSTGVVDTAQQKDLERVSEGPDDVVCHVHDSNNRHVGTGEGSDASKALGNAVVDANEGRNNMVDGGSFGCSESGEEAHQKAIRINESPVGGLPGF